MKKLIKRIVLFGPESTGKTILAQQLATHFNTLWVSEFAREYLETKKAYYYSIGKSSEEICLEEDIPPIVKGQISAEDAAYENAKKLIFLDTNPLQTKVYVSHYYQKEFDWLNTIIAARIYDYYLLTDVDVNWEPDPLRDRPDNRTEMFNLFKSELKQLNTPFTVISGTDDIRLEHAVNAVNLFLSKN
jgi:HTH-type transcriptional repressor of NAD biosynthesis genes